MFFLSVIAFAMIINVHAAGSRAQADLPGAGTEINVIGWAGGETDSNMNLIRGFLSDQGFDVRINILPDAASWTTLVVAGNYDLALTTWTTVTGNPDYAVRSIFRSDGPWNRGGINDSRVDQFIDLAATQTPAEWTDTYRQLENALITDNAYIIPFYRMTKTMAVNRNIIRPESATLSQARGTIWNLIDYANPAQRENRPLRLSQQLSILTSLDPIRGNDGSIQIMNQNTNVRLVNLSPDDSIITDGALSYQYVIAEGNSDFYFVLRDNLHFARVENRNVVNTGVRVGASDVVFSLTRAVDRNSVPDHRTFSLFDSISDVSIVTDLSVLDSVRGTGATRTMRQIFEERTPTRITSLTANSANVNNANGVYQVVRVRTHQPFPQVLNFLAHMAAGIVSEQQVRSINTFEAAAFDRNIHIPYGDQSVITEGPTYNHHVWASGPYIPIVKNDYEIVFERNPFFMPGTEWAARIRQVNVRFIVDKDTEISAFRSEDLDMVQELVPVQQWDLITSNPNFELKRVPSHQVIYLWTNQNGSMRNRDLRLAVLHSINQDDTVAFYQNRYFRAYSTLSSLVDTGNVVRYDPARVAEHMRRFREAGSPR